MKWTTNKSRYYWDEPKWFEARNKALVEDKMAGMAGAELTKKYNITQASIHRIVKSFERKKNGLATKRL